MFGSYSFTQRYNDHNYCTVHPVQKTVEKRHCSKDRHCMSSLEHTVGAKIIQVMVVDWCKVSAALYKNEYKLGFMH